MLNLYIVLCRVHVCNEKISIAITLSDCMLTCPLTILKDSFHIEAVSGAGLVVCAALQVIGQLSGPRVINNSGVGSADGI